MSSIVTSPVAQVLIDIKDVLFTFKFFGLVYFAIIVMCALFLEKAPDVCGGCIGHSGDDSTHSGGSVNGTGKYTTFEMLKSPVFYLLICIYAIGACGGLIVISQTSNMAQEIIHVSAQTAAVEVSLVALGNTVGRIFWGTVSDKGGRYNVLPASYRHLFMRYRSRAMPYFEAWNKKNRDRFPQYLNLMILLVSRSPCLSSF